MWDKLKFWNHISQWWIEEILGWGAIILGFIIFEIICYFLSPIGFFIANLIFFLSMLIDD